MLAAERQAKIAELIRVQGSVQVDDLAHDLKVSTMTIRRDLEKLQEDLYLLKAVSPEIEIEIR